MGRTLLLQPALLNEVGEPLASLAGTEPELRAHDAAGEVMVGGEKLFFGVPKASRRASVVSRSCLSCVTILPQLCHDDRNGIAM